MRINDFFLILRVRYFNNTKMNLNIDAKKRISLSDPHQSFHFTFYRSTFKNKSHQNYFCIKIRYHTAHKSERLNYYF